MIMWIGRITQTLAVLVWIYTVPLALRAVTPSCDGPLSRAAALHRVSLNSALSNHVLRSRITRSLFVCVAACIKQDQCLSVNYESAGGTCELNGSIKETHPADVEVREGWKHYGNLPATVAEEEICPPPTTTQPATTQPATTQPATTQPATTQPATTQPATTQPATTQPATTQPATTQPPTTQPPTTQPPTTQPPTTQPPTTQPPTTQHATTQHATTQHATTQPPTTQPPTTQPATTQPATTQPATTQPPTTQPPTTQPPTTQPPTTQPPTTQPPTTQPPTTQPPTTQPPTTQPPTTQPATTQHATTQHATTQHATTQPATTQATTTLPTTVFVTTEKPPIDCWDIHTGSPLLPSGQYTVYPSTRSGPLQVYCDMDTDDGGWTVIQRRTDDTQDFNQNWAAYKAGFGDLSVNFWLGNDALHELTTQQECHLRIELQSYYSETTYAKYGLFTVADETNDYRLTVGKFYGSYMADDSLVYHNGMSFSTMDQDNDVDDSRHCGELFLGGWWFANCLSSNLNGPFSNGPKVPQTAHGVIWGSWLSVSKSLKFAEMKLRPVPARSPPKDCWDHKLQGETVSGLYNIYVTGRPQVLQVYCDMDDVGGGWTVIQRRVDGSRDFYLYWADYKAGFGDPTDEFWFGNDDLRLLTNQTSYQLTVKLTSWSAVIKYANYKQFSIADEADKYRLSVGGFSGSLSVGDSLGPHNGIVWSTQDKENDNDPDRHCAENKMGAWWYDACEYSNLNGPFVNSPGYLGSDSLGRGIMWGTWKTQSYSLSKAEMKVRPSHVGFSL